MHRLYRLLCTALCIVATVWCTGCFNWENTKNDRTEQQHTQRLYQLSTEHYKKPNPAFEQELQQYLKLAEQKQYKRLQSNVYLELAQMESMKGDYQKAISYANQGLMLGKQDSMPLATARLHNELGIAYDYLGQYHLSIEHYKISESVFEQMKDLRGLLLIQNNLALIYQNLEDYTNAELVLRKALGKAKRIDSLRPMQPMLLSNLATVLLDKKEYAQALPYVQQVLATDVAEGNRPNIAASLSNMGTVYTKLKRYDSAVIYLDSSITLKKSLSEAAALVHSYHSYAQLFAATDSLRAADSMLALSRPIIEKSDSKKLLREWYVLATEIAVAKGDYPQAFQMLKAAGGMKDSLDLARFNAELNGLEKDAEISRTQVALLQQKEEFLQQRLQTWALAGLLLLTLCAGTWIYLLYRKQIRLKRAVEHKKLQIEDLLDRRTKFLGFLAHEIRNPLSGMLGMNRLLLQDTPLNALQHKYISFQEAAGYQLLNLLNNLLDYQKMQAGALGFKPVPLQLNTVLQQVQDLYQTQITQKSINYAQHIDAQIPDWIEADPVRLTQIFGNLLHNAIKFSGKGGQVVTTITVTSVAEHAVTLLCSVADNGVGISKDAQKYIVEQYKQASAETLAPYSDGTGLGLSFINDMLHKMNSRLLIESKEGKGSTFSFSLALPIYKKTVFVPSAATE